MIELADILFEMDARERNPLVLAHHIAGGAGQLDLDRAADADRLIVLGNLIILRRIGIEIIFAVPFADGGDFAAQHQARLDDGVERGLVHHRQGTGQRQHDGIGQRVLLVAVAGGRTREHLRPGFHLDVDFQADDGFVADWSGRQGRHGKGGTRQRLGWRAPHSCARS